MPTSPSSLRFDPLMPVHKAMRRFMFEVLTQVGALDATDMFEVDRCVTQVARLAGVLPDTAEALLPLLDALPHRDVTARRVAADALYRGLTRLVSDQLSTQIRLEAEHTTRLQAVQDDLDLRAVRRRQLATMSEQELADALRWMGDAVTPRELASFVDDLQTSVDAQTFGCLVDHLRRHTGRGRWQRVARELGMLDTGTQCPRRPAGTDERSGPSRDEPARRPHRAERSRARVQ